MLRLPVPLLRARGTPTTPDDRPGGVALGSARGLKAVCAGVSTLAVDPPQTVGAADAGVRPPAAGTGDPCPAAGEGTLCPVVGVDNLLPTAGAGDLLLAAGAGDPRPAADVGDLGSVLDADTSVSDPGVGLASPSITVEPSPPAPRGADGGLAPDTTS